MSELLSDLYTKQIQTFIYNISNTLDISQHKLILDWNILYKDFKIEPLFPRCMHIIKGTTDNYCYRKISEDSTKYCKLHSKRKDKIKNIILKQSKNNKNYFIHQDTKLLFNKDKIVICKENYDGTISELSDADKNTCKLYGFKVIEK